MPITYFCPSCWFHDMRPFDRCPCCGHDLSHEKNLTDEERLISALSHPIREQRMIALEMLGRLRYREAIPHIAKMLEAERDYYIIRECVLALRSIEVYESERMLAALARHPSMVVRELVSEYRDGGGIGDIEKKGKN